LDVYKTTAANSFTFSFLIEKKNANNEWEIVSPTINQEEGSIEEGDFVLGHSIFDPNTNNYNFRSAIQLNDAGNFRLSFGYDGLPSKTVILRSDSFNNNLFANVYSVCDDLDGNGYYYYTVNE
jgi:hypothetical protein